MPLVAALRALSAATGWASGISEDPPRATSLLAVTSTQGGGAVAALRPLVAVVLIASPTPPAALLAELLEAFEGLQGELRGDVLPDQGFAVDAAEVASVDTALIWHSPRTHTVLLLRLPLIW